MSCCRRNPYGASDYTRDQIESLYASGMITEDRYRELMAAPLASQRAGFPPDPGPDYTKWGAVALGATLLVAAFRRKG